MRIRSLLLAACSIAAFAVPAAAQQQDPLHNQPTVSAAMVSALPAPAPNPAPLAPLSLLGFALVGATEKSKARKMNLSRAYTFGGQTYGPGVDVELPEGFPEIDGETGDVVHPPGSAAARNAYGSKRLASTAPTTGGVDTGETAANSGKNVSGLTGAELEAMSKGELVDLAAKKGVTVTRGDGEEGEPLKGDYVKALSASA